MRKSKSIKQELFNTTETESTLSGSFDKLFSQILNSDLKIGMHSENRMKTKPKHKFIKEIKSLNAVLAEYFHVKHLTKPSRIKLYF